MAAASVAAGAADLAHRGALWMVVAIGFSIPVSTALDNLLLAGLLLLWIASGRYADKWAALRSNPFVLFPCSLFVLHLVGAIYSAADPVTILRALDKASTILLIPVLVSLAPGRHILDRALLAFMAGMLLTLSISFLLWLGTVPEGGFIKGIRADPSVFKMHITHGFLMSLAALLFALKYREAKRLGAKAFFASAAALAAINVLFMVHGRTGQLVLLALGAYLLIARFGWRGLLATAAAGSALSATVYVLPSSALHGRVAATVSEIREWRAGKPAALRNMRLESWSNSVQIIRESPILGVGTGGFAAAYAEQVQGTSMLAVGQPENQYLLTAVQLGAVGLTALLAMFAAQWRLATRLSTRADTDCARGLVVAMVVGSLFNSFLLDHTEALFYAWLSGLLYAGARGLQRDDRRSVAL
jgi:O-antigen ligase